MAIDNSRISFEPHGWTFTGGAITRVGTTTAQAYAGNYSLYATFKAGSAVVGQRIYVLTDRDLAGQRVTVHFYPPLGMKLGSVAVYARESGNGSRETKNVYPIASLVLGAWNTLTLDVPSDATPLVQLGLEFSLTAIWSGTAYVDSIDWSPTPVVVVPPPSASLPPPSSSLPPPSSSLPPPSSSLPPPSSSLYVLPADRTTIWNPGLNSVGGIPNKTTVFQTLNPSGGDDTVAIQNSLNSCPPNQVVQLSAGTFKISGQGLELNRSNVILRGMGPASTVITRTDVQDFPVAIIGTRWISDKFWSSSNLAFDGLKDSNSVTLTSVPSLPFSPGEIVLLDAVTDPAVSQWGDRAPAGDASRGWFSRMDRPFTQLLEISSVSGNTVTFSTKLHGNFLVSRAAQLSRYGESWRPAPVPAVKMCGIEDLTVEKGRGGDGGGNIHFFLAAYCWVKNVESRMSKGTSVNFDGAFRCVLRDSHVHTSANPNPGGEGYLVGLNYGSSDNLVENNVVWNGNKCIVMRSTGGGNVIGYNLMQDAYGAGYKDWVETGLNASHMTTPHHELFEGNESFAYSTDSVWGNSNSITVFRNNLTGLRTSRGGLGLVDSGNRQVVGLTKGHWKNSFVGNVLGYPGMPLVSGQTGFIYEMNSNFGDSANVPMWKLGYNTENSAQAADPQVLSTILRHGNYEHGTNTLVWDSGSQLLPDSLYLTSKPDFFGNEAWPWVNPSGLTQSDRVKKLPARIRFDLLHP